MMNRRSEVQLGSDVAGATLGLACVDSSGTSGRARDLTAVPISKTGAGDTISSQSSSRREFLRSLEREQPRRPTQLERGEGEHHQGREAAEQRAQRRGEARVRRQGRAACPPSGAEVVCMRTIGHARGGEQRARADLLRSLRQGAGGGSAHDHQETSAKRARLAQSSPARRDLRASESESILPARSETAHGVQAHEFGGLLSGAGGQIAFQAQGAGPGPDLDLSASHHHHHDHPVHPVRVDNQHHHYARHQSSPRRLRPSYHEAELQSDGALHHIGRCYYGGRDSSPAIPRSPNLAASGLEGGR